MDELTKKNGHVIEVFDTMILIEAQLGRWLVSARELDKSIWMVDQITFFFQFDPVI